MVFMVHINKDMLETWAYINILWKSLGNLIVNGTKWLFIHSLCHIFCLVLFTGDALVLAIDNSSVGSLFMDETTEIRN